LPAQALADLLSERHAIAPTVYPDVAAALKDLTFKNQAVIATGSIVTAGAIKRAIC
jgi:hypothetical protein